jgi:hypothetical protein
VAKLPKWTISIQPGPGSVPKKVTKIVSLKDGGFSVLTPYHEARSGFLFKMPIGPDILQKLHYQASFSECVSFSANDRVKLSYHADGFAQFSGEVGGRIISGRDPVTKEPKGLGLITHPLAKPIWTGGSVGITMWGIEAFDDAKERDECICFEPDDFYYRDCTPSNASGWHVRIYAFPRSVVPPPEIPRQFSHFAGGRRSP